MRDELARSIVVLEIQNLETKLFPFDVPLQMSSWHKMNHIAGMIFGDRPKIKPRCKNKKETMILSIPVCLLGLKDLRYESKHLFDSPFLILWELDLTAVWFYNGWHFGNFLSLSDEKQWLAMTEMGVFHCSYIYQSLNMIALKVCPCLYEQNWPSISRIRFTHAFHVRLTI